MNRTKTILTIVGIASLLLILMFKLQIRTNRVIDWTESYNERSNKPYGTSILYKELPQIFKDQTIKTVYYPPSLYFYANSEGSYGDHIAKGTYLLIGNSDYLKQWDIEELLLFASHGNHVLISDHSFPKLLLDSLNLDIQRTKNTDSVAKLSFTDNRLIPRNTLIDKSVTSAYFSSFDPQSHTALGYVADDREKVNFLEIPFEGGTVLLHLEPKVFTNYNLLKDEHYHYTEGVLSYLPSATIYFDSYNKLADTNYGQTEKKSNPSWFLQQKSFRWATYLALILGLLFVIFNAKRRQRIIPIIKPLNNTTVDFVKTISNLYYETQDHKNLIEKKITYFLEKIRSDYHLDTTVLDDAFIERLSQKSGKNKESVKKTINFINWLQSKNEFFEGNLLKLNSLIEEFYS